MAKSERDLPDQERLDEEETVEMAGGPDALEGGGWGAYDPVMADLEVYLGDLEYPVDREELVEHVREQGAPPDLIYTLAQLPDQPIESAADIMRAFGQE